jgi:hypothetical protein
METTHMPRASDVVDGRFVVLDVHCHMGGSPVYEAYDRATGDRVAVRILPPGSASCERFARQRTLLSRLRHPGIARHVAHGTTRTGAPYVVSEWMEGEDLTERLRREGLGVADGVQLGIALARGLAAAHACGIVHRHLRPSSIFLPHARVTRAKILDFGLAGPRDAVRGLVRGGATPRIRGYTAPEVVLGEHLDAPVRADLFSLGCVLYEAIAHRAPFQADDPKEVLRRILFIDPDPLAAMAKDLPAGLCELVAQLLEKDPAARPASAEAVALRLCSIAIRARRPGIRVSVIHGADRGLVRTFGAQRVDIGQHPSATLQLQDDTVSPFHCELARRNTGSIGVRAVGTGASLEVDGVGVLHAVLHDRAVLGIGRTLLSVQGVDDAELGLTDRERAGVSDTHVLLEGRGDARSFAEGLHLGSSRRRGAFASVYGSALRLSDLSSMAGGTLLLLEPESLTPGMQEGLAAHGEATKCPSESGRKKVGVRIVAHAKVDLRVRVNEGYFMADLFRLLAANRVPLKEPGQAISLFGAEHEEARG